MSVNLLGQIINVSVRKGIFNRAGFFIGAVQKTIDCFGIVIFTWKPLLSQDSLFLKEDVKMVKWKQNPRD
ncbi:hypothetical protein [Blautia hydrogenotrophica]|uniref:Uncharacterized protein n=1 Tax=Blautia hydrogenotrophica (strain DSM 10507 / JCM 14656 / S5a33) TaxID=476272 RepID=C0CGQ3_BLAHS|nr:hypothetical protein [Blautia hydrogenotrophica]EEG50959.1 hypothetical protein RUMHYD_00016 [Blautia hydrogenotrophica DSM 10507]